MTQYFRASTMGFLLLVCAACRPHGETREALDVTSRPALTENALTENALTENALTENALTENALTENALTENALTENALTAEALRDPNARMLLKYLIRVAFNPGDCETFPWRDAQTGENPAVYCGRLGLCPQWRSGGIQDDVPCQEWVTAGLLAHINAFGVSVPFSARAVDAPSLLVVSEYEAQAFRYREGAFWGNLFARPRTLYAAGDVRNAEVAKLNQRMCATVDGTCVTDVVGPVDAASVGLNLSRGWACDVTATGLTWMHSLHDPSFFFDVQPGDVDNLSPTMDERVTICHPYLTPTVPTPEQLTSQSHRVVTTYLTEAGVKRLHGCSDTMFPEPTGPCADSRQSPCDHPGDPCCAATDGTAYCADWQTSNGHTVPQACVNDEVSASGQSSDTCTPVR